MSPTKRRSLSFCHESVGRRHRQVVVGRLLDEHNRNWEYSIVPPSTNDVARLIGLVQMAPRRQGRFELEGGDKTRRGMAWLGRRTDVRTASFDDTAFKPQQRLLRSFLFFTTVGSREFSSPRFQPAFGSSYAYLEGLSGTHAFIEVVVGMG